ncbi:hypothetical protein ABPG74_016305 [Tetrahymena malaccensis]
MHREVSQAQVVGNFHSLLIFNKSFEDEVSWTSQSTEPELDTVSHKQNFILEASYQLDGYCNLWKECNQDQKCINDISSSVIYNNQSSKITYQKYQIQGWTNPMTNQWSDLDQDQKQYILKTSFAQQITKAFQVNHREKDGIFNSVISNLLPATSIINNSKFGGPFQCNQQSDGHYQKYLFSNPSQFGGFQYITQSGAVCGNSTSPCSCQYYNTLRLFPIEWRCRPWYLMGKYYQKISISQPYIDLVLQTPLATLTFKIEQYDSQNNQDSTYAILGIDFDFKQLQNKFQIDKYTLNNSTEEIDQYAYLVAPTTKNFDTGVGFYTQQVLAHPFSSNLLVQNITTLEFQNSTNSLQETQDYLNKTFFLNETNLQKTGCDNILQMKEKYQIVISKNQTLYTTLFTPIEICFGDFQQQQTLTVGYLAMAFSEKKWIQAIQETKDSNQQLFFSFYIIISCCFITCTIVYFTLIIKFLQYNFDIPIDILNQFIQCAQPLNILKFYRMIENGQIKTQKELKNLIQAIFQVVVGVQQRIQDQSHNQECIFSDQAIKQYQTALKAFKIIQHNDCIGLCLNNIARILKMQGKYDEALKYMQKANLQSEKKINELFNQFPGIEFHKFLNHIVQIKQNKYIMNIYAGRKFQLANIIFKFCQKQSVEQFNTFKDICYNITNSFKLPNLLEAQYSNSFCSSESFVENHNFSLKMQKNKEIHEAHYLKSNNQSLQQLEQYQDIKMLITQAIDLLQEASIVYKEIYISSKFSSPHKKNFMILLQILCLQLIIKCLFILKNRIELIKNLLSEIKTLLKIFEDNITDLQRIQFFVVLKQKFYVLKGSYYFLQQDYFKSVKCHLKSLEVLQKNQFQSFYDTKEFQNSLVELQNIIYLEQIPLSNKQLILIQEDIEYLKEKADLNYNDELNFLEIFFQYQDITSTFNKY